MPRASIHKTALVDSGAKLGRDVTVGPFAVVEKGALVGRGTRIGPRARVCSGCRIGEENAIHIGAIVGGRADGPAGSSEGVVLGDRNVLREYTLVAAGNGAGPTRLGNDNYVMTLARVGPSCQIGEGVVICNGTNLEGFSTVEDKVFISGHVHVETYCRIGEIAMISGMSSARGIIPPFMLVVGDSEVAGVNNVGMTRAGYNLRARRNLRRAFEYLYRSDLPIEGALAEIEPLGDTPEVRKLATFIQQALQQLPPKKTGNPSLPEDLDDEEETYMDST